MARTASAIIELRPNGVLYFLALPLPGEHTPEQAEENVRVAGALADGRMRPLLSDLRDAAPTRRATRQIYANGLTFVSAQAAVVGSMFSRVNANIFLRVVRPRYPTRVFNDEAAAEAWLLDQPVAR